MKWMKFEKVFGLLSIATLGLIAMACVPNVKPQPVPSPMSEPPSIQLEVDAVRQVELINAGGYSSFTSESPR